MSVPLAPSVAPAPPPDTGGAAGAAGRRGIRLDPPLAGLVAICLAGVVLRIVVAHQSLFADELSSYWIVTRHSLAQVIDLLYSRGRIQHAEITPPLVFLASWLTAQLGHTPELLRAPSLIAGALTLPAVYALGRRSVGRPAALLACAITALSPFMIYYSAEDRSYGLMMLLTVCTTLSMLLALDTGRRRWWVAYGAASAGAFLTHYTCAFLLLVQFVWLLCTQPAARRAALLANAGAMIALLPWAPGLIEDFRSPTTQILSALSPFTLHDVRLSVEHWAIGFPYVVAGGLRDLPGTPALVMLALAAMLALGGALTEGVGEGLRRLAASRIGLIALLALSVPVGEAAASAVSTHIFGVRNLAASWPALALTCSALVVRAPRAPRRLAVALTLVAFSFGAVKMLSARFQRPDFAAVASYIERQALPRDVVLDGTGELSPGPLTGLDLTLRTPLRVVRFGAPQERDHPFNLLDVIDPVPASIRRGFALAAGARVFLVRYTKPLPVRVPTGYRLLERRVFPSLTGLAVEVYGTGAAAR